PGVEESDLGGDAIAVVVSQRQQSWASKALPNAIGPTMAHLIGHIKAILASVGIGDRKRVNQDAFSRVQQANAGDGLVVTATSRVQAHGSPEVAPIALAVLARCKDPEDQ